MFTETLKISFDTRTKNILPIRIEDRNNAYNRRTTKRKNVKRTSNASPYLSNSFPTLDVPCFPSSPDIRPWYCRRSVFIRSDELSLQLSSPSSSSSSFAFSHSRIRNFSPVRSKIFVFTRVYNRPDANSRIGEAGSKSFSEAYEGHT